MKRIPVLAACMTLGVVLIVSALIAQQNPSPVPSSLAPEQASDPAKKKVSSARPAPAQQNTPADFDGAPGGGYPGGSGGPGPMVGMGPGGTGPNLGMGIPGTGFPGRYPGMSSMMGMGTGAMFDPEAAQAFAQAVQTLQSDEADEAAKEAARKLIADQLRLQFDMDQANRRRQIEELASRIAQLREQLEKREEAKERLVELRIMLLENESAGLGFPQQWNQLPGMSGQSGIPGTGMYGGSGGLLGGPRYPGNATHGYGGSVGTMSMDMGGGMGMGGPEAMTVMPGPSPAAIALPAATADDPTAKNLQQIAMAVHSFHDAHRAYPAAYNCDFQETPLLSWRVHILPYLGHADLYEQFHLDEPWDSEHNRTLVSKMPDVYRSPGIAVEEGNTLYLGNAGKQGVFVAPRGNMQLPLGIGLAELTDGDSHTIMVVECNVKAATIWTKPEDFVYEDHEDPWPELLDSNGDGFQTAMCDGRWVVFPKGVIERTLLTALFTRNGGETIPGTEVVRQRAR